MESSFLKSVFGAAGIVTAWIFLLGWVYLHTYYEYFGLNVNALDFPSYHYLIFCFAQFVSFRWRGLIVGVLLLAVFMLTWWGTTIQKKFPAIVIGFAYLFVFWIGFHVAVADGK